MISEIARFLLGMFLAYYLMSPKLRRLVNGLILGIIRLIAHKKITRVEPVRIQPHYKSSGSKTGVEVETQEIERWFRDNPDLVEVNK